MFGLGEESPWGGLISVVILTSETETKINKEAYFAHPAQLNSQR